MITPSFSPTATERVLPKLALDFTTASLDSRVTFTRTTDATHPATYTNSSGYITSATNDQPRFDYNPLTLACKGLLIEESRTNAITYSEDYRDTATAGSTRPWIWRNATVTYNSATSPSNTTTANLLIESTAASAQHDFYQAFTTTAGTAVTVSFYAKAKERTQVASIGGGGGYGTSITVIYDLVALTTNITTGTATATITDVGNGWRRCTWTGTPTITNATNHFFELAVGGSNVYTGDGTSGAYFWGIQIENGAFATSYIPTTTTTLTRNADVATMTGTNFSSWFNATQGAFAAKVIFSSLSANFPMLYCAANAATGGYYVNTNKAGAGSATVYSECADSTTQATINNLTNAVAGTALTATFAYKANSFAASGNGGAAGTDTSGTVPSNLDTLYLGSRRGLLYLNGWIQKLNYWPQRLTDNEVQAFSK